MPEVLAQKEKFNTVQRYWRLGSSPFDNVPNPDLFYLSPLHKEGLIRIYYAIKARKGAAMLTGDIGSGKTTLSRLLIQRLPQSEYEIALINNPTLSHVDFLREINYQLGIENGDSCKVTLLHKLNERLLQNSRQDKDTIIIVDEAQVIKDNAVFEELRLLLNFHLNDRFLFTLILIGQPNLRTKISRIKQFEQRIAVKYHLGTLNLMDTARYIIYRLERCGARTAIFTNEAIKLIYNYTNGIPRLINNLCDLCLLSGYLSKANTIRGELIEKIVADGAY